MTAKQFEEARDTYSQIHAVTQLRQQVITCEEDKLLRHNLSIHGWVDDPIIDKIEAIRLEHTKAFKNEVIRVLGSHIQKLEEVLSKI